MITRVIIALSTIVFVYCKIADNDSILPVMHIKEVQDGYLTWPDKQLGDTSEQGPVTTACTPRSEAEAEKKMHGMLKTAEERPFNDTTPFNGTEIDEEEFELKILKPLCDD